VTRRRRESGFVAGTGVQSATIWFYVTQGDDEGLVELHALTTPRTDAPAYQTPAAYVVQLGFALEDAYAWAGAHKTKSFGTSPILSVDNVEIACY
jgi:hypothetical protein